MSGADQARRSGFAVGENWLATDAMYAPGPMGWYARLPTAQSISADLRTQAAAFAVQEAQTATDVVRAAGDLGGEGAVRGHIQAAGHGFKTGGGNDASGPPPDQPTDLGGLLGAPPGNSFIDQYQQAITAPPTPRSAALSPMPASPPPRPPQMGPPPGGVFPNEVVPNPTGPAEVNPSPGVLAGAAAAGCGTGAGEGSIVGAFFPPIELFTAGGGCVAGALIADGGYLGGIWLDNMFNGNG